LDNFEVKEPIEEGWEKIEANFNKNAPKGINNVMQSSNDWVWMVS